MKIFSYPLIIKEHHLDTFGHVNNATYLSLFEEARWEIMANNGYSLEKVQTSGLGPTLLEIQIRFIKELRLREEIIIETQVTSHKGKITRLEQKMLRNGELCCTAEFVMAFFDVRARKLIVPPPEWLQTIGIEEND